MRKLTEWVHKTPPDGMLATLDILFGIILLLQSEQRDSAMVSYRIASAIMSMRIWGVVMIAIGASIAYVRWNCRTENFARHHRTCFTATAFVRIAGPGVFVCWAVMAAASALAFSSLTFTAVPFYLYIAWRHYYAPNAQECEEEFVYRLRELQERNSRNTRPGD